MIQFDFKTSFFKGKFILWCPGAATQKCISVAELVGEGVKEKGERGLLSF